MLFSLQRGVDMRKIIIKRKWKFWGCLLLWQVKLDNNIVATLRNGDTISLDADSDKPHVVQCVYEGPGDYGGTKKMVSDIINIPADTKNYSLLAKANMMSMRLEIVEID